MVETDTVLTVFKYVWSKLLQRKNVVKGTNKLTTQSSATQHKGPLKRTTYVTTAMISFQIMVLQMTRKLMLIEMTSSPQSQRVIAKPLLII